MVCFLFAALVFIRLMMHIPKCQGVFIELFSIYYLISFSFFFNKDFET